MSDVMAVSVFADGHSLMAEQCPAGARLSLDEQTVFLTESLGSLHDNLGGAEAQSTIGLLVKNHRLDKDTAQKLVDSLFEAMTGQH